MREEKSITIAVRMVVAIEVTVEADRDNMDPDMAGERAKVTSVQYVRPPHPCDVMEAIAEDPESFDGSVAEAWGLK